MFHVTCDLPNASNSINGVTFKPHNVLGVKITADPVEKEIAALFKGIPGYSILDASVAGSAVPSAPTTQGAAAAQKRTRKPRDAQAAGLLGDAKNPVDEAKPDGEGVEKDAEGEATGGEGDGGAPDEA